LAFLIYVLLLQRTRSIFWGSLALFVVSAVLMISGLKRAFSQPNVYRGKIAGIVLSVLGVLVLGIFGWGAYMASRLFASALHAPQVGQRAPGFTTVDAHGNSVTLAQLLSTSLTSSTGTPQAPKGVLLIFYRGYW
ncbi:MAG TPA: hypothetical protein VHA33_14820, partial [Candidatus Angelobacter sp.]|nr:hypothetical protein [Candidatus Angelobacter sp.]